MKLILTSLLTTSLSVAAMCDVARADTRALAGSAPMQSRLAEAERDEALAFVALKAARDHMAAARARWDAAVADDDPVQAGKWARRHFDAMQARFAAEAHWRAAADAVNDARRVAMPSR